MSKFVKLTRIDTSEKQLINLNADIITCVDTYIEYSFSDEKEYTLTRIFLDNNLEKRILVQETVEEVLAKIEKAQSSCNCGCECCK